MAAARQTAALAGFVPFETNAPMCLVVGRECAAVADLLAILASDVKLVLTAIAESPVRGRGRPLPIAALRKYLNQNAEAGFVGQLESRVAAPSRRSACCKNQ